MRLRISISTSSRSKQRSNHFTNFSMISLPNVKPPAKFPTKAARNIMDWVLNGNSKANRIDPDSFMNNNHKDADGD